MKRDIQGTYMTVSTVGEPVRAFVPASLPPTPPIEWTPELRTAFDEALLALGRLDSVSTLLPQTEPFLYMYVRKEAVLSSMIEGTQSSLSDLLLFELDEMPGVPLDDVREVSNYVAALDHGMRRLREGFPLSLRLMREIHGILLAQGRGAAQRPGEFRSTQNWIGGTRPGNAMFVPPPPERLMECLGALERFLHDEPVATTPLLKAALAHVQFETIHPFLDGNGRLGRLLITLLLCQQGVLQEPMLYLSLYFKTHRQHYYRLLNDVRETGDWEAWLRFFSEAVSVTAAQAVESARDLHQLVRNDRERVTGLGRAGGSALQVLNALSAHPIATAGSIGDATGLVPATVNRVLVRLCDMGIVTEITNQKRNRVFGYTEYIAILNRGTDLPD